MAQKNTDDQAKAAQSTPTPEPSAQNAQAASAQPATTSDEPAKNATAKAAKADEPANDEPSPTQVELDAIKAGEYRNRALTSK